MATNGSESAAPWAGACRVRNICFPLMGYNFVVQVWLAHLPVPYRSHIIGIILLNALLVELSFHILCAYLCVSEQTDLPVAALLFLSRLLELYSCKFRLDMDASYLQCALFPFYDVSRFCSDGPTARASAARSF
jgi:hypothetical protein